MCRVTLTDVQPLLVSGLTKPSTSLELIYYLYIYSFFPLSLYTST